MKKPILASLSFLICIAIIWPLNQRPQWEDTFGQFPKWDVPYVPTPYEVVEAMLEMAGVKESDTLYDLGCGDGRIVITAASRFGTKGVGIDIDPERIQECLTNAAESGVEDRVTFLNQNLFETDFSAASVVTLYLLHSVNLRLRPKLLTDLNPGTRVVSHDFSMGSWKPDRKIDLDVDYRVHEVYFWTIPANASGRWRVSRPSQLKAVPFTLTIKQQFQEVQGQAELRQSIVPIQEAELIADRLRFSFITDEGQTCSFQGMLNGHHMQGRVTIRSESGEKSFPWEAERDPKTKMPIDPGDENY